MKARIFTTFNAILFILVLFSVGVLYTIAQFSTKDLRVDTLEFTPVAFLWGTIYAAFGDRKKGAVPEVKVEVEPAASPIFA